MRVFGITMNFATSPRSADTLQHAYIALLTRHRVEVIPIPNTLDDPVTFVTRIGVQGFVLTGGNDVVQLESKSATPPAASARDKTESAVLSVAVERQLPVLGICRGMQFLNCYFGGAVLNDVARFTPINHAGSVHDVILCHDIAIRVLGIKSATVNSFHNHGVGPETLATSFDCLAVSPCGRIVEAILHRSLPIVGAQWHPERPGCAPILSDGLVSAFLDGRLSASSHSS